MTQSNQAHAPTNSNDGSWNPRIDFWSVVNFLISNFKQLMLGGIAGAALFCAIYYSYAQFRASLVLPNLWGNVLSFRAIEGEWAIRALQRSKWPNVDPEAKSLYLSMSNELFWVKTVETNFSLKKSDLKEFAGLNNENNRAPIQSFKITTIGRSLEIAEERALQVADFILSSSQYTALNNKINDYEVGSGKKLYDIDIAINNQNIKLQLLRRKLLHLEELKKHYPENIQAINIINSDEKYIPVNSQIIAVKNEIFDLQESTINLQKQAAENAFLNQFAIKSKAIINSNDFEDRDLVKKLIDLESQLRAKLPSENLHALNVANKIRAELFDISSTYRFEERLLIPVSTRVGSLLNYFFIGFISGFAISMVWSLRKKIMSSYKSRRVSNVAPFSLGT